MGRPVKGTFSAWLRGGQTIGHTFDMIREVILRIMAVLVLPTAGCILLVNWRASDAEETYGTLSLMARLLDGLGTPLPQKLSVPVPGQGHQAFAVQDIPYLAFVQPYAELYNRHLTFGFLIWLLIVATAGFITVFWYINHGREKLKTRQIKGQVIVGAKELLRQIVEFNTTARVEKNRPDHVAPNLVGIPYPMDGEFEHTLITGGPGSGKSVAIHRLIRSIRERGDKAVIYDPEGEYIRQHYDPETDIILNPFDDRAPAWSPFFDAREHVEWNRLAHGLFKENKSGGGDPYWTEVSRSVFAFTCWKLQEANPSVKLEVALEYLFGPNKPLETLLKGTPAAKHLAGTGGRVDSIASVVGGGVTPLVYLLSDRRPFSIRKWINNPQRQPGFLFFSAPETHADTLRPLLGFWSEITISSLLSRSAEGCPPHPTWVILDEFPSLGRVDALAEGPARLRKHGGAMVFGLQQISQLQDIYGRDRARTIVGQCSNKLVLRANDPETAQMMSEMLGERVMSRVTENTSYGANSIRDGVGIAPREEKEAVFLPTQVLNFPALTGAIRVSNRRPEAPFPIAPVKFKWDDAAPVNRPFVQKTGPDLVRVFLNRHPVPSGSPNPAPPPTASPAATATAQATGGGQQRSGPVLVVDNDASATSHSTNYELPLDPADLPTPEGQAKDQARRRHIEEMERAQQRRRDTEAPDRPEPTQEPSPTPFDYGLEP